MPATVFSTQDQWHVAEIALPAEGETIQSGPCKAASRKTAEQLAALAIIRQLAVSNETKSTIEVDEQSAERLRQENAKGKLLELCTRYKIEEPRFVQQPTMNGFAVSVSVTINKREPSSRSFRASTLKTAQQAAAADLLNAIGGLHPDQPGTSQPATNKTHDHRSDLNNLRQQGVLSDFGYEVTAKQGPDHKPSFIMRGWAKIKEGKMLQTEPIVVEAKKEGALQCANALWEMLRNCGIIP
jgi:dsRNA-specific ribonuclease